MADIRTLTGDVLSFCRHYHGPQFHAILTDAPYHLTSITERFGKSGSTAAQFGRDGAFQRASAGFMNQVWDGGDIAFRPETWAALAAHVLPGGFIVSFGGSRGYHRMAAAMEDAGLVLHPSVFLWAFGSGFPKATRIDTQQAESEMAARWVGHRYGLQALKPAVEPIVIAQKPYVGRPLDNITQTGAGAYNIDAARIGIESVRSNRWNDGAHPFGDGEGREYTAHLAPGRWPANFVLGHSPECRKVGTGKIKNLGNHPGGGSGGLWSGDSNVQVSPGYGDENGEEAVEVWDCVDNCPVKHLGEQSGELASGQPGVRRVVSDGDIFGGGKGLTLGVTGRTETGPGDTGTAARFFFNSDWNLEVSAGLLESDPVRYEAKASRSEREEGLVGRLPCRKCGQLYSHYHFELRDAPESEGDDEAEPSGYKVVRPGTKGARKIKCRRNAHPTIKPIALTTYLARLLLPPQAYSPRRILVPFSGTGSEVIGAALAGWECVVSIEGESDYMTIQKARLAHYCGATQLPLL